jgi:hypothetical protein
MKMDAPAELPNAPAMGTAGLSTDLGAPPETDLDPGEVAEGKLQAYGEEQGDDPELGEDPAGRGPDQSKPVGARGTPVAGNPRARTRRRLHLQDRGREAR